MAKTILAPVMAVMALAAGPAQASITIVTGAPGVQTDENVLFQNLGPADAILTATNKGTKVTFTGQETLNSTAGGQAKITGADGQFSALNFFATDPATGFSAVEFSLSGLNGPGSPRDVYATIRFFDQFGAVTTLENALLGNGQSWFSGFATLGSAISRVEISTTADIRDARHFRIGAMNVAGAVPEPATWLMLIAGFGLVGGALRHRNRRTLVNA